MKPTVSVRIALNITFWAEINIENLKILEDIRKICPVSTITLNEATRSKNPNQKMKLLDLKIIIRTQKNVNTGKLLYKIKVALRDRFGIEIDY